VFSIAAKKPDPSAIAIVTQRKSLTVVTLSKPTTTVLECVTLKLLDYNLIDGVTDQTRKWPQYNYAFNNPNRFLGLDVLDRCFKK
jgi:hypothetical protein